MNKCYKIYIGVILILISVTTAVFADGYRIIVYTRSGISYFSTETQKMVVASDSLYVFSKDNVCHRISSNEIDSVSYEKKDVKDTVVINWEGDKVRFVNPLADDLSLQVQVGTHIILDYSKKAPLFLLLSGQSDNGSLKIDSKGPLSISLSNLQLKSKIGEVINVRKKVDTEIKVIESSSLSDCKNRPAEEDKPCKACLYTKGNLTISGSDTLHIKGNYANAIQSNTNITINNTCVKVGKVTKNAFSIDQGVILLNDAHIDLELTKKDTKGFKTDSLLIQRGGSIKMNLLANQCKGIKAKKDIVIEGGKIEGYANGGVVIEDGDPSYCTFLKSDGDILLSDAIISFEHDGEGGKCLSADSDLKFVNSTIKATLTGNGGYYVNVAGEDDYYTPRAIEAGDSLSIISGKIDLHCTGIGGKGMVCDHDLTIGELDGNDDKLTINILTEGSSIVNDTIADFRKGCPKAIKSADQLDILSGNIYIKTLGMGGEGLESKNEIWIVGGTIICETFDDGVNGDNSINVYGGNIYTCSQDNDGFDSNGCINIYGGNIFSISLHPLNESFDTEGNSFNVSGGNILGIGGGSVMPEFSAIPLYTYPRYTSELVQKPMPEIDLTKGEILSIVDGNNCILSGRIPADLSSVIVTVGSAQLNTWKQYKAVLTSVIDGASPLVENYYSGGMVNYNDENVKFNFKARYYEKND